MEMIMRVQPTFQVKSRVFENKRHFRVDLSSIKTLSFNTSIKMVANQTPLLTNVCVPTLAAQKEIPIEVPNVIRKSLWGILYTVGFLTWFLSSY